MSYKLAKYVLTCIGTKCPICNTSVLYADRRTDVIYVSETEETDGLKEALEILDLCEEDIFVSVSMKSDSDDSVYEVEYFGLIKCSVCSYKEYLELEASVSDLEAIRMLQSIEDTGIDDIYACIKYTQENRCCCSMCKTIIGDPCKKSKAIVTHDWYEINYSYHPHYLKAGQQLLKYTIDKKKYSKMLNIELVIVKEEYSLCNHCKHIKYSRDKVAPEPSFNGMLLSHGLSAYSTVKISYSNIANRINDIIINPDWEICCSNNARKIGPIGIDVNGISTYICSADAYSFVFEGIRYPQIQYSEGSAIKEKSSYKVDNGYCEHFVKDVHIKSIWVKRWSLEKALISEAELDMLCEEFNVNWYVVSDKQA